jgi:hypothetical protein
MKSSDGQLRPLHSLFDVYKKRLHAPQKVVVTAFCEVMEDLFGVTVPAERVVYKPGSKTLVVSVSGALKSELKMREDEVLTHLKGRVGAKSAPTTII